MSIAALITQGIGPQGSVYFLLTEGLGTGQPAGPSVIPHDDYYRRQRRLWWNATRDAEDDKERLQALRREIGLLPPEETPQVEVAVKAADRAVKNAVTAIIETKSPERTFDYLAAYEAEYRKAIRSILSKARAEDAEVAFRAEVRRKLIVQRDEELLLEIAEWL